MTPQPATDLPSQTGRIEGETRVKPFRIKRRPDGSWEAVLDGGAALFLFESIDDLISFETTIARRSSVALEGNPESTHAPLEESL